MPAKAAPGILLIAALIAAACTPVLTAGMPSPAAPAASPVGAALAAAAGPNSAKESPSPSPSPSPQTPTRQPTARSAPELPPLPEAPSSGACPGTKASILMPGRQGQVSQAGSAANRVRSEPGTQGKVLGQLGPGAVFDVLSGPRCAEGMAWFEVRGAQDLRGWMAEGNAAGYFVSPPPLPKPDTLPGFRLSLPDETRAAMRITSLPFDPGTRTPPATAARLADYPWEKSTSTVTVFIVEDYLYYLPEKRAALEQVRAAINALLADPSAKAAPGDFFLKPTLGETYRPQAGAFRWGFGMRALAMLPSADEDGRLTPHYAYWGFSPEMRYLIYAAFPASLGALPPERLSLREVQRRAALFDRDMGFTVLNPLPPERAEISACQGAPAASLQSGDWARVRTEPRQPIPLYTSPGGAAAGEAQPGENLLVLEGPRCAGGAAWWRVRALSGREGWSPEAVGMEALLVEPIYAWSPLPAPIPAGSAKAYGLRELRISPDPALVNDVQSEWFPLATPVPTPASAKTPWVADPREGFDRSGPQYAAHSAYHFKGSLEGWMTVTDLQDPLSRAYFEGAGRPGCVEKLQMALRGSPVDETGGYSICGMGSGGIPLHFQTAYREITFHGGRGVRYLISSANDLTVRSLDYVFQGLSDDGRYFISFFFRGVSHPYAVGEEIFERNVGPLRAWRAGQFREAEQSIEAFNARIEVLLDAGAVPLYPSLEVMDAMMESIEVTQ